MPPFNLRESVDSGISAYQNAANLGLHRSALEQTIANQQAQRELQKRALDISEGQHFVDPSEVIGAMPPDVQRQFGPGFTPGKRISRESFKTILDQAVSRADLERQQRQAESAGTAITERYTKTGVAPGTTLEPLTAENAPPSLAPPATGSLPTVKTVDPDMALLAKVLPFLVRNKEIGAEVMGATLPKPVTTKPGEQVRNPRTGELIAETPLYPPWLQKLMEASGAEGGDTGEPGTTRSSLTVGPAGATLTQHLPAEQQRAIRLGLLSKGYPAGSPEYREAFLNVAQKLQQTTGGDIMGVGSLIPPYRGSSAAPGGNAAQAPTIAADVQKFRADAARETDPARKAALLASAAAAERLVSGQGPPPGAAAEYVPKPLLSGSKPVAENVVQDIRGLGMIRRASQEVERALTDPNIDKYIGPYAQYGSTVQGKAPGAVLGKIPSAVVDLEQNLARIKNYTIKLITGAQMSQQEATRIMQELPDQGTQSGVFRQRFKNTQANIKYMEDTTRRLALSGNQAAKLAADELGLNRESSASPAAPAEGRQVRIRDIKNPSRTGSVTLAPGEALPPGTEEIR